MKHNYNDFTKQELVSFLQKNEENFRYIGSPYDIIIDQKIDVILKKIYVNIKRGTDLTNEYKKTKDGLKYLIESKKNNDEWSKLDKEYDRLEKLRFPRRKIYE